MKKISIFTISALIAMAMLSITACELWSGENNDTTHDPNDTGPNGRPEFLNAFDDNKDGLCDYCNATIILECEQCYHDGIYKTDSEPDRPNVTISIYEGVLNKNDTCDATVSLSESLNVSSNIKTDVFILPYSLSYKFTTADKRNVEWRESEEITISFKINDDSDPAGMIIIFVTSRWPNEKYTEQQINRKLTKSEKIFYATDDTHIAFSTVSVEDAQSKLN